MVKALGPEYGGCEFESRSLHLKPETKLCEERGLSGCRKGLKTVPLAQALLSLKPTKTNKQITFLVFFKQVNADQSASEPGWLGGELNGKVGWFPESYVEKADDSQPQVSQPDAGIATQESIDTGGGAATATPAAAPGPEPASLGGFHVLQDWTNADESLSIKVGDEVQVLKENPTGWSLIRGTAGTGYV